MDQEAIKNIAEVAATAVCNKAAMAAASQILVYALILVLFIALPTIIDIFMAYGSRKKTWTLLIDRASRDTLDKDELRELIKATAVGPPGISGMSRALMALAVIIILGIAVFHLLVNCTNKEVYPIIDKVLSMLAATLASITGFYFGGRSTEEKKKEEPQIPEKPKPPPAPSPPPPAPPEAEPGGQAPPGEAEKPD